MASFPSQEHRPLKKPRLGLCGPDVYPQDKKQKEDELTPLIVKHGFSSMLPTKDEYGSARDSNPASSKVGAAFSAIIAKKIDINTFPDQTKRKLPLNTKDNFYLAQISRGKAVLELWFRDLSSTKPLMQMVKKVPVFNKKEETFHKLCEENVPLFRCAWFIKMTNAYNATLCEATKAKKRQAMDPFLEWSQALARYLREQLLKILEHYQGTALTGFLTAGTASSVTSFDQVMRNWDFGVQMTHYLYEEGLLDRHEFLTWLVELLEKLKVTDDTVLKLILAQIMKYLSEFVQSQLLSRRLVFFCCKKLAQICSDSSSVSSSSQSPNVPAATDNASTNAPLQIVASQTSLQSVFTDYSNCPQHRSLLLSICSVIQAVTLSCPSALVWHDLGEGKSSSSLSGSPLDLLPCPISCLPMPLGNDNNQIRTQLKACEEQIIMRSKAVEIHWSSDKNQQSTIGLVVNKVLAGLEILDRHNFEKVEPSNCLDVLYNKLFNVQQTFCKDGCENVSLNEASIKLLCEWAVTTKRTGEHRAVVVAKLLEKYQCDILSDKLGDGDGMDDRDSVASDTGQSFAPPFQNLLMQFLDKSAPIFEENDSAENKQAFANLVLLFSELILHDIFSHDAYICTLISRGDIQLSSNVNQPLSSVTPCQTDSIKSEGLKPEMPDEMKSEHECHNLESEFGILAFKDELRPSPDQPGSVKSSFEQSMFAGTPGQAHTPATCYSQVAYTPGAPHTPISVRTPAPHTPGASHTPGAATPGSATSGAAPTPGMYYTMVHTPNVAHTPGSLPPPFSQSLQQVLSFEQSLQSKESSRHLIFVTHFPIAVDDLSCHESNQRLVILYGVGRQRDEARHLLKKVTKEVGKLFSKKSCLDTNIGDASKLKKKKEKDQNDPGTNLENIFNKFRKLSYYDQHAVTNAVSRTVIEVVGNFASANSTYLPMIDNISYMFDLMEFCLNISHLLELAIKLLKEQPEVEAQLMLRASPLAGGYTTSLCLCIVGVLRKYHACLLVSQEQTATTFESLVKVVKHVDKPNDCTSPERSILAYLYDLYTSCYYLRTKYSDLFGGPCTKVKNALYADVEPSSSNLRWEEHFSKDLMDNPRLKVEMQFVKQLNDTPANRYSFVCSAIVNICNCQSVDRLNDIAILCAELTACCTSLSSEWLGVLKALCWSSNHNCGFIDVLTQVDVGDFSIHDSLAVFTAILIARHCFTLEDLVGHVALQSLLAACPSVGSGGDPDAELGARLTCHLLLRLFQMMNTMPGYLPEHRKNSVYVKSSCDRHLLEAEHKRINVGAVVAVLKAILMLGDSCHAELRDRSSAAKKDISVDFMANLDDCGDLPLRIGSSAQVKGCIESAGLSDYAKYCLREICSQEWVREKFLKEPDQLFKADLLLDKMLSHKQAQQLVQMICYPGGTPDGLRNEDDDDEDDEPEQRRHITRILHCMDQWSQRVSGLELQLMIKQATSSEMPSLLENIAKSTIEVFQREADHILNNTNRDGKSAISGMDSSSVWLIGPLIAKLPFQVQGRVLKTAGQVLETGNNFWSAKNSKDRERYLQRSNSLLGNQPFLSLVLTCLRGQIEQREGLLKSLHDQLEKFVTNAKEQHDRGVPPDEKIKFMMQEALQLRLSLVGNMFDTIQHNNTLTQDWAILLIQLISNGIVDVQTGSKLFTTVMDMLAVLIHGTLANDTSDKGEDNKKSYQSLIRKLKKELGERKSTSIDMVRQLLPLPKKYCEVIVCDTHGTDSKGANKTQDVDRKHTLQISRKERVSPWEILEGHKNPAPLNLSWFGAVKLEKKQLKYEEQHRLLFYHTHSLRKPASYFLEPPILPPEDLDQQLDKPETKPMEQSLEPKLESCKTKKSGTKGRQNRKTARNSVTPTTNAFTQNVPPLSMNFARPEAFPPGPPSNWYAPSPYPQQINPTRGFPLTRQLGNAIKARVQGPNSYLPAGNWPHGGVRQRPPLTGRISNRICADPGMFAQQTGMLNQGFPGYGSYPQQAPQSLAPSQSGMIEQAQSSLNPSSFTPTYQGTNTAMGLSNQPASYLSSQSSQQAQFPASSARYAALPVMNNIGPQGNVPGSSMASYGQLSSGRQLPGQTSNFNKQKMLLMPQSQQLPQHQPSNSSSLMRQMAGNNTGGGNQPQNFPPTFY